MNPTEADRQNCPVLVVAHDDRSRAAIVASSRSLGRQTLPCACFSEAQDAALAGPCGAILVDLATMIKAKDAEKIIAHTMTEIYPTLRVKSMGPLLIPMIMAGDARQDRSLSDFFSKTCASFAPRKLRSHRRKEICVPTSIGSGRGFTVNLSWSGVFIVDMNPERFRVGQEVSVRFLAPPEPEFSAALTVVRLQRWGERHPPGIGMQFKEADQDLEQSLSTLLKSDRDTDHDRLGT